MTLHAIRIAARSPGARRAAVIVPGAPDLPVVPKGGVGAEPRLREDEHAGRGEQRERRRPPNPAINCPAYACRQPGSKDIVRR